MKNTKLNTQILADGRPTFDALQKPFWNNQESYGYYLGDAQRPKLGPWRTVWESCEHNDGTATHVWYVTSVRILRKLIHGWEDWVAIRGPRHL